MGAEVQGDVHPSAHPRGLTVATREPIAFYRLQLTPDFGFREATTTLGMIASLGCSHVYLSPVFEAAPGSRHGYDVTDPTAIRAEFGGLEGLRRLVAEARSRGLGVIIDIVPNHMASSEHGPQWRDVLARGESSPFARWFDLRWRPIGADGRRRLLLPILGSPLDRAIAEGQVRLVRDGAGVAVEAHGRRLPVREDAGGGAGAIGDVLEAQHYALVHWQLAREIVAYRRYFDIGDLVALRMDDEVVFRETHALLSRLASEGLIDGVRVDHIDGLADPAEYTRRLRRLLDDAFDAAGRAERALIYVEKTLGDDERLPDDWPVDGTTGYDLLASLTGVFARREGLLDIGEWYSRRVGAGADLESAALAKKLEVCDRLFRGETDELADAAILLAWASPSTRDIRPSDIRRAVVASAACCPVVRTYITAERASDADLRAVHRACDDGARLLQDSEAMRALEFVRDSLAGPRRPGADTGREALRREFATRWQRMTVPLAAKGFEDATLYNDARCLALNEIGVEARAWQGGCAVGDYFRANERRVESHPFAMTTTSTHDTKRSEDVRARLFTLTTLADEWKRGAEAWRDPASAMIRRDDDGDAPDRVDELFTYQTLLGAWPLSDRDLEDFAARVRRYVVKASRESGRHSNWISPNAAYESAWSAFAFGLILGEGATGFRESLRPLLLEAQARGALVSLAQCVLKTLAPGVPDIYWGNDGWDFSLVDPDNRRPVDFDASSSSVASLPEPGVESARELLSSWRDGRVKRFVQRESLRLRASRPGLFTSGGFVGLSAERDPFVAFGRRTESAAAIVVASRGWGASEDRPFATGGFGASGFAGGEWREVFTGRTVEIGSVVRVEALLDSLPVAALVRAAG